MSAILKQLVIPMVAASHSSNKYNSCLDCANYSSKEIDPDFYFCYDTATATTKNDVVCCRDQIASATKTSGSLLDSVTVDGTDTYAAMAPKPGYDSPFDMQSDEFVTLEGQSNDASAIVATFNSVGGDITKVETCEMTAAGAGTAGIFDGFTITDDSAAATPTCATYSGKSGTIEYDSSTSTYVSLTFITEVTAATAEAAAVTTSEVWLLKSLIQFGESSSSPLCNKDSTTLTCSPKRSDLMAKLPKESDGSTYTTDSDNSYSSADALLDTWRSGITNYCPQINNDTCPGMLDLSASTEKATLDITGIYYYDGNTDNVMPADLITSDYVVTAAQASLTTATDSVTTAASAVTAATNDVATKQGLLDTANADIVAKQGLLDTAQTSAVQADIDAAQNALVTAQDEAAIAQTALTTAQTDEATNIQTAQTALDAANADVVTKQTALNEAKQNTENGRTCYYVISVGSPCSNADTTTMNLKFETVSDGIYLDVKSGTAWDSETPTFLINEFGPNTQAAYDFELSANEQVIISAIPLNGQSQTSFKLQYWSECPELSVYQNFIEKYITNASQENLIIAIVMASCCLIIVCSGFVYCIMKLCMKKKNSGADNKTGDVDGTNPVILASGSQVYELESINGSEQDSRDQATINRDTMITPEPGAMIPAQIRKQSKAQRERQMSQYSQNPFKNNDKSEESY